MLLGYAAKCCATFDTGTTFAQAVCFAVPLIGRSVDILQPILKRLRLILSARSDHDATKKVFSVYPAMLLTG